MSDVQSFRDLLAWQKSMGLAKQVYAWTGDFPTDERFGIVQQMRRAVVSVPSNIAEGYARGTTLDYLRCLRIARGSIAELDTQIELSEDLRFAAMNQEVHDRLADSTRLLQALIRSLEHKTR